MLIPEWTAAIPCRLDPRSDTIDSVRFFDLSVLVYLISVKP